MVLTIEAPCTLCGAYGATDQHDHELVCADAEACCGRRMGDELCAWCGQRARVGRMNICAPCDNQGWVRLPDGSWIEEQLIPRLGYAFHGHGMPASTR